MHESADLTRASSSLASGDPLRFASHFQPIEILKRRPTSHLPTTTMITLTRTTYLTLPAPLACLLLALSLLLLPGTPILAQDEEGEAAAPAEEAPAESTEGAEADAAGAELPAEGDELDAQAYSLGFRLGERVLSGYEKLDLDLKDLAAGLSDAVSGAESQVSLAEMELAIREAEEELNVDPAQKNKEEGEEFLAEKAEEDGVEKLESGVLYKVIEPGEEGVGPDGDDLVQTHYEGRLIDGTVFDSSYNRGQPFPVNLETGGVIQGWLEVLPKMNKGAVWEVYIPSELAYGEQGSGARIGPNATLIFKIEVVDFTPQGENAAEAEAATTDDTDSGAEDVAASDDSETTRVIETPAVSVETATEGEAPEASGGGPGEGAAPVPDQGAEAEETPDAASDTGS